MNTPKGGTLDPLVMPEPTPVQLRFTAYRQVIRYLREHGYDGIVVVIHEKRTYRVRIHNERASYTLEQTPAGWLVESPEDNDATAREVIEVATMLLGTNAYYDRPLKEKTNAGERTVDAQGPAGNHDVHAPLADPKVPGS
jgi:hypothetical protein